MVRKSVVLDEKLNEDLKYFARKEQRDFSSALRYALRIGLIANENPELTIEEIKDIIAARVDYEMNYLTEVDMKDF